MGISTVLADNSCGLLCGHYPWAGHLGKRLTALIKLKEKWQFVPNSNLNLVWYYIFFGLVYFFSKKKIEKQSTVLQIQKVNLSNKGILTLFSSEYLYGWTALWGERPFKANGLTMTTITNENINILIHSNLNSASSFIIPIMSCWRGPAAVVWT